MIPLAAVALAAVGGAVAGSYISTAALRATRGEGSVWGRSHCDGCGRTLSAIQTLPLVSFATARGACAACGGRIDPIHPAAEASGALVGVALLLSTTWPMALALGFMAAALLASAVVDWRTRRLPDGLTLLVGCLALFIAASRGPDALVAGVVAAAMAFALLMVVRAVLSRLRKRQALGFGDVKLICALALWLGAQTPVMVAAASILALGLVAARPSQDGRIAFGPMIALAGWTTGVAMERGWWPS